MGASWHPWQCPKNTAKKQKIRILADPQKHCFRGQRYKKAADFLTEDNVEPGETEDGDEEERYHAHHHNRDDHRHLGQN